MASSPGDNGTRPRGRCRLLLHWGLCAVLAFACGPLWAGTDIRVAAPIDAFGTGSDYVLTLDACADLVQVDVLNQATPTQLTAAAATARADDPSACEIHFTLTGPGHEQPRLRIVRAGGSQEYAETFVQETRPPELTIESVVIEQEGGIQYLRAVLAAADDTDLAYLNLSLTGIRASDLRRVGGVVAGARESAFLATGPPVRLTPNADDQQRFSARLPLTTPLSAEEVRRNALVLVEATAVDASGNQTSLGDVRYLGDTVEEGVVGFTVAPSALVFTDMLQSARIIPTVTYEFRGPTPLPGSGQGVSYRSSDASVASVGPDGLVYPMAENPGHRARPADHAASGARQPLCRGVLAVMIARRSHSTVGAGLWGLVAA